MVVLLLGALWAVWAVYTLLISDPKKLKLRNYIRGEYLVEEKRDLKMLGFNCSTLCFCQNCMATTPHGLYVDAPTHHILKHEKRVAHQCVRCETVREAGVSWESETYSFHRNPYERTESEHHTESRKRKEDREKRERKRKKKERQQREKQEQELRKQRREDKRKRERSKQKEREKRERRERKVRNRKRASAKSEVRLAAKAALGQLEKAKKQSDNRRYRKAVQYYKAATGTALEYANQSEKCLDHAEVAITGVGLSAANLAEKAGEKKRALEVLHAVRTSILAYQRNHPEHFGSQVEFINYAIQGVKHDMSGLAEALSLMIIGTQEKYGSQ